MIRNALNEYKFILLAMFLPTILILAYVVGSKDEIEQMEQEEVADYQRVESQPVAEADKAPTIDPNTLTVPTQFDKVEAQEIASAFVMAFHAVDAKNPYQYLADSKPYMTDSAFKKFDNIPKRGTLETQKLEPTATDLLPVDLTDSVQIWRVGVTSQESESQEYVFTEYQIELVKEGQSWKVDGVNVNE